MAWVASALVVAAGCPGSPPPAASDAAIPERGSDELYPQLAEFIALVKAQVADAPHDAQGHGTLGYVYEAHRMWREAHGSFAKAAELDPREPMWRLHLAIVMKEVGQDDAALQLLSELADDSPELPPVQQRLGECLLERGEFDQAARAFERLVACAPESPHGYVGLGDAKLRQGDFAGAAELLARAVAIKPRYRCGRYLYGQALLGLGRREEAERELLLGVNGHKILIPDAGTRLLDQFKIGSTDVSERGMALLNAGLPAAAAKLFEKAIKKRGDDPALLIPCASAYSSLGRIDEALTLLGRAQEIDPTDPMVPYNVALCQLARNAPAEALRAADAALALAPLHALVQLVRGRALIELSRFDEAERALLESRRLQPENPIVHEELGKLYWELGRWSSAAEHYALLCQLAPSSWQARLALARAQIRIGAREEAVLSLAEAQALAPDEAQVIALAQEIRAQGAR